MAETGLNTLQLVQGCDDSGDAGPSATVTSAAAYRTSCNGSAATAYAVTFTGTK
ncbi:MAG: hypothetical protein ACLPJH_16640 [Myxococcaceae bacterium]